MNILAATTDNEAALDQVYNVAVGGRTTLNELYDFIQDKLMIRVDSLKKIEPTYRDFRAGDVRHSMADISKAKRLLGYVPKYLIGEGLEESMDWYVNDLLNER